MQERLRDIHGLDPLPVSGGEYVELFAFHPILYLVIPVILALLFFIIKQYFFLGWKKEARQQLQQIYKKIRTADTKEVAVELSILIRRIAMTRCGRDKCAGLEGEAWLKWLTANDPKGFKWTEKGQILLELPYAPPQAGVDTMVFRDLIRAIYVWTKKNV